MQVLKEEIIARNLPLGSTTEGRDWCIKALHPSDPLTEVRGIPDHSAVPSVLMNYQSTFTLAPQAGATGSWSFDASLLPHPIAFMAVQATDSVGTLEYEFDNTQLTGATHAAKYATYTAMAQRWRLAYMAVTVYQDGPDLANQGTIVVSQPPVMPRAYYPCFTDTVIDVLSCGTKCVAYDADDAPNFATSQATPNAYFNRSREGAYVPLKLTETCQDWSSEADAVSITNNAKRGPDGTLMILDVNDTLRYWPFWGLEPAYAQPSAPVFKVSPTSPLLNGTVAHISAKNLDVGTKYSFFVRCGIEMQVSPSSLLSPQLKLSPPYDPVALDAYFMIARELKDGFPANYNDLGKIWDAISSAAADVLPILQKLGPYGQAAASIGRGIVTTGNLIRSSRQRRRNKPTSAAPAAAASATPPTDGREQAATASPSLAKRERRGRRVPITPKQ